MRILGHVKDVRVIAVDRVPGRLELHAVAEQRRRLGQRAGIFGDNPGGGEIGGEVVPREQQRAAGVFFLTEAEQELAE